MTEECVLEGTDVLHSLVLYALNIWILSYVQKSLGNVSGQKRKRQDTIFEIEFLLQLSMEHRKKCP